MKVLHVVSGDLSGGAGRGVLWLHRGLLELNIDSVVLSSHKPIKSDEGLIYYSSTFARRLRLRVFKILDRALLYFYPRREKGLSLGVLGVNIRSLREYRMADVINIHWVNNGFVSLSCIKRIDKPVLFTLRDMWSFTGLCHYSRGCTSYYTGCGTCPLLKSKNKLDISLLLARYKRKCLRDLLIVGISPWISKEAEKSFVFKDRSIRVIWNNVDLKEFYPVQKANARKELQLPLNKKLILVTAVNINAYYKGFSYALESVLDIKSEDVAVVFVGKINEDILKDYDIEYYSFGFISDPHRLRLLYSAVQVLLAPSTQEAFGKTIIESFACGTPVVCFDNSGPGDLVSHKVNGYVAESFSVQDMSKGINWVLRCANSSEMSSNCIANSKNYDYTKAADMYKKLYHELLVARAK